MKDSGKTGRRGRGSNTGRPDSGAADIPDSKHTAAEDADAETIGAKDIDSLELDPLELEAVVLDPPHAHRSGGDTVEVDAAEVEVVDEPETSKKASKPAPAPEVIELADSGALTRRDSLQVYMAEMRRYPVLSPEEEHELAVRFHETGDEEAAYRLVTSNLRFVVKVAREYQRAVHNLLDLIQEGNVGLLEAVRRFDPHRGVRLPSYAVWWIRAYVIRYVMNNFRMVKVGTTQAQRRLFFNLQKEKARLEASGFTPTTVQLAENLGVRERDVEEMQLRMAISAEVSADAPVGIDTETRVLDLLPSEANVEEDVADSEFFSLMKRQLDLFSETLSGRDEQIWRERLVSEDPITLAELGGRWGVSRERVRQVEAALKKKLREFLVDALGEQPPLLEDSRG
ncbi:MAG: RNA polymerase factor sigma-32 [Deltaproteobacteria bacterium]|jgi:RNA polymerase sigma-32 factor|nr:RNA polymerase factor sigma-32 [Deltaproteobacteria bacterium]